MAKHTNMVGGPLWWGALGPAPWAPPKSGAGASSYHETKHPGTEAKHMQHNKE